MYFLKTSERTAIIYKDRKISYKELVSTVNKYSEIIPKRKSLKELFFQKTGLNGFIVSMLFGERISQLYR